MKSKVNASAHLMEQLTSGSQDTNVLPRSYRRRLRYCETYTFTTGTAGVIGAVQAMRLNSLYDPNKTGTGHQPYGFDQLSSFYGQFLVHSCKWSVLANTIGGNNEVGIVTQEYPSNTGASVVGLTLDAAVEKDVCSTFTIGPSGNDRCIRMGGEVEMHKLFGVTKEQYADSLATYAGTAGANPSVDAILEVAVGSYSAQAGETVQGQILLEFDAEFFGAITIAQS